MGGEREHHHHWNDGESMTDCPGLNVVMGHGWNEQQHCAGCAENTQLRAQLKDSEYSEAYLSGCVDTLNAETRQLRAQLATLATEWRNVRPAKGLVTEEDCRLLRTAAFQLNSILADLPGKENS